MRTTTLLRGLFAPLVIGLAACGGSSGGSSADATDALLTGSYHYLLVGGKNGPPISTLSQWGIASADGAGHAGVTSYLQDVDDVVSPGAPFDLLYSVGPSRAFDLLDGLGVFARGGISPGGEVVATATTRANAMPALVLMLRRNGMFSNASLAGTYHYFMHTPFAAVGAMLWGTITFDGAGNYVRDVDSILAGTPNGGLVSPGTYSVAADGTLTIDADYQGGLLSSGDVALLTGPIATPALPVGGAALVALVRRSTSAGLSTLSGDYRLVGRMIEHPQGGPQSAQSGTAAVTSPGTLSAEFASNSEGSIGPPQAGEMYFTVAPDGGMALLGDEVYVGAVAPGGDFVVALGGITYGSDAQIVLLVR